MREGPWVENHEHRRFPFYFVQQLLPHLFYPDAQRFFAQVSQQSLRALWLDGNRQLSEKTPPDGLSSAFLEWGAGRACLLTLPRAVYPGEAIAVLLAPKPAIYCLEKMENSKFALTGIDADGVHTLYQQLSSPDAPQFVSRCKQLFL